APRRERGRRPRRFEVLQDRRRFVQHPATLFDRRHPSVRVLRQILRPELGAPRQIDLDHLGGNVLLEQRDPHPLGECGERVIVDPEHARTSGRFYPGCGRVRHNWSSSRPDSPSRTRPSPSPMAASAYMAVGRSVVTLPASISSEAFPALRASRRNHRPARTNPIPPASPAIATTDLKARIMCASLRTGYLKTK